MPHPTKSPLDLPPTFRELLRRVEVPLSHMSPRHTASLSATVSADLSDSLRGLAQAYGVTARDVMRAALVIGVEELLGSAEELGHAATGEPC